MNGVNWVGVGVGGLFAVTAVVALVASMHPDPEVRKDSGAVLRQLLRFLPRADVSVA